MGTAVVRLIAESSGVQLAGAATEAGHPRLGEDAGTVAGTRALDVAIGSSVAAAGAGCDVAIDFSSVAAFDHHLEACVAVGCGLVVGTTGLSDVQSAHLEVAARQIPVVYGRNMSVGVLVFQELARIAARHLGSEADIEIIETHHRNKVDAPSGTALQLGEAVAAELGHRLEDVAAFGRFAASEPRRQGTIGFSSVRAGNVVGDHDIQFALAEEIVTLSHRALDRATFARGALRAARWLGGRPPGLYSMADVLGIGGPGR